MPYGSEQCIIKAAKSICIIMPSSTIVIDEFKCNGCGLCVQACHEGALEVIDGKAKLVRADYCDGLGDCLPACPMDAISFAEDAPESDNSIPLMQSSGSPCTCPSSNTLEIVEDAGSGSELRQWPIKIRLISESSPMFNDADLLLVADCSAFAYGRMHEDFIKGRTIMTCCPKFDAGHVEKLTNILSKNDPKSLTIVRMSVPCCSLDRVAEAAIAGSGSSVPVRILVVDQKGNIKNSA